MPLKSSVFSKISSIVSKIPEGKVCTYKQVAEMVGVKDYRLVGFALHRNRSPKKIPCHRVVKSDGTLANGYAMGGMSVQKKLLESEGIRFSGKGKINLTDYLWNKKNKRKPFFKIIRFSGLPFLPASHEDKNDPGSLKKVLFQVFDISPDVRIQMINWARILKGKSFHAHYHEDMDEIFIIMNGRVKLRLENQVLMMGTGDAVYIPQRLVHQMFNQTDRDIDYIALGLGRGKGGKSVNV